MTWFWIFLVLAIIVGVIYIRRRRARDSWEVEPRLAGRPRDRKKGPAPARLPGNQADQLRWFEEAEEFTGVRVDHCGCEASAALQGREFPIQDAPHLPVPGCTATMCTCQFIGLPDRRSKVERRVGAERRQMIRMQPDRRSRKDRRRSLRDVWTQHDV